MAHPMGDCTQGAVPPTSTTRDLLAKAREGDRLALDRLFGRLVVPLRRWARGRLPGRARAGFDTADVVQEALVNTFRRIDEFEPRRKNALRAYLQKAIDNRIRDAIRSCRRRVSVNIEDVDVAGLGTPLEEAIGEESTAVYRKALQRLDADERQLIVARIELGYSYEQLALAARRPSPDAARMAVKRALLHLAEEIARA
jgi:RNA polymerase sigma-70 factor (ECF subfamily)